MLKLVVLFLALGCTLGGIPGGRQPADVNSPDVQIIATFAVSYLNGLPERSNDVTITKVIKAERQVVTGINYFLDVEVTEFGCTSDCQSEICAVTVFDQEWTNTRSVTHFHCHHKVSQRHVPVGGLHPISVDSQDVKDATQFAVTALNKMSNSMYASALVEIKSAESQIVAGLKLNLGLQIRQTKCQNVPDVNLAQCAINTNTMGFSMKRKMASSITYCNQGSKEQWKRGNLENSLTEFAPNVPFISPISALDETQLHATERS